ncbi:MAG TPA: hypothetical protein VEX43_13415, partial [Chthoniobacterales bacterium]|nr:hypothetical protein [Chthoniobacterales bacterium]
LNSAMKRRLIFQALVLSAACSALFLTGCVTTETRISQHPEMFQRLSPGDQALVREGKIRNGMSREGVYLAWGGPDQKTTSSVHGRPAETWVYTGISRYPYPYGWGPGYYGRGFYGYGYVNRHRHGGYRRGPYRLGYDPFYDPFYSVHRPAVSYPERTVSFQNGRVVAFQFLHPPRVWN